jgi:hypothetical protein
MIWLTWRQFRVQALVVAAAIAVLVAFLAITGPGLLHDYAVSHAGFLDRIKYDRLEQNLYYVGQVTVYAAPPVIGAFWGAPLIARELEAGTHRLVWNQSISRTRWLVAKLAITGLGAMVLTGLLSLAVTWWSSAIDDALDSGQAAGPYNLPRLLPAMFGSRGVVPIGYAAFAFALGVAIGLVTRRSIVAIAVTLAAVIAVEVLSPMLLRAHLMTPATTSLVVTTENMRGLQLSGPEQNPEVIRIEAKIPGEGNWKVSEHTVNSAGQVQKTLPSYVAECGPPPPNIKETETAPRPPISSCFQRLADDGYRQEIKYFPADSFWPLQWREFGLFLLLAAGLTGFSFWRIKRDLT